MSDKNEVFDTLFHLDVNERVEKKKAGNTQLTYLSWAWAWAEVKKRYAEAQYEILKFDNNQPYVYDEKTGYMVFTKVTIEDITHEMWLPVMDGANKAMKSQPYDYQVINWTNGKRDGFTSKSVEAATMFDINKTIMRCLVKNLAMFGLGLYIYSGEDLPETEPSPIVNSKDVQILDTLIKTLAPKVGKTEDETKQIMLDSKGIKESDLAKLNKDQYGLLLNALRELNEKYEKQAKDTKKAKVTEPPKKEEQETLLDRYNKPK